MKGHNPAAKNESLVRISERFQVGAADFTPRGGGSKRAAFERLVPERRKQVCTLPAAASGGSATYGRRVPPSHHPTLPLHFK